MGRCMTKTLQLSVWTLLLLAGCATAPADIADNGEILTGDDLPLGEQSEDDKADGRGWGSATRCKEIPNVPQLPHPQIVVSLNGLTLHLFDHSVGYDRVFPIGPGAINTQASSPIFGESRSYYPLYSTGRQDFTVDRSRSTGCKMWWTDPDTGAQSPVFAGLPFLSWSGSYGIHGPIDNYRAPNGGNLRRGFVSHGCIRMEAADILEVYARTKSVANLPVHVQREPERDSEGVRTDLTNRWVGSECSTDSDCNFDGGICHSNPTGGRSFCTMRCSRSCPDRVGNPETFCVADPAVEGEGMCVPKVSAINYQCRPYDHFVVKTMTRNGSTATASVCVPGSPGWVGDRCLAGTDCRAGLTCAGGLCTTACNGTCMDMIGYADTACVDDPRDRLGVGAACARQCIPANNGAECAAGSSCIQLDAHTTRTGTRNVCIPTMSVASY